jgi:HK97 family phage major capsid protein
MKEIKEMQIEELEARSSEIVAEIEGEVTEERLKELDAESVLIEERKNELKKAAAEAKEVREAVAEDKVVVEERKEVIKEERKMTNLEVRKSHEYEMAYVEYLKSGMKDDAQCRSLLTENVSGSVPVPVVLDTAIQTAWEQDKITSRVRKMFVKGNLKVGFEVSSTGAVVHTEGDGAIDEETLVLGTVTLIARSVKKFITVSDEALDSNETILRYIQDELVYQIVKKIASEIVGAIAAAPAASTTSAVGVAQVTASALALDTIAQGIAKLQGAQDIVLLMNPATWAAFKALAANASYGYDPFEGFEVIFTNDLKSFASASEDDVVIEIGDLKGVTANFPNGEGVDIKIDALSQAEYDLVKILGREFVGIGVTGPGKLVNVVKGE